MRKLEDRLRRARINMDKKELVAEARNREFFVSVGESLVGMFLGRRSVRSASSSLSKYRMKSSARMAIEEAEERIEGLEAEVVALEDELKGRTEAIGVRWEETMEEIQPVPILPRRSDIDVDLVALGWEPYWLISCGEEDGARRTQSVSACFQ
jgi:hypothetical protein